MVYTIAFWLALSFMVAAAALDVLTTNQLLAKKGYEQNVVEKLFQRVLGNYWWTPHIVLPAAFILWFQFGLAHTAPVPAITAAAIGAIYFTFGYISNKGHSKNPI
jgi:hypothetical protein